VPLDREKKLQTKHNFVDIRRLTVQAEENNPAENIDFSRFSKCYVESENE